MATLNNANNQDQNAPIATGLAGGHGQFYFWPELNAYASIENGEAGSFRLTPDQWEMMKDALLPVTAVKVTTLNQLAAKAAPVKRRYQVSCSFETEGGDPIEDADNLSLKTVQKLLSDHGIELDGLRLTQLKSANRTSKGVGAARAPQGDGTASNYYRAASKADFEAKPLTRVQAQIIGDLLKGPVKLANWQDYGFHRQQAMIDFKIGLFRKGFQFCIDTQDKAWVLTQKPYDGFTAADLVVKA